MLAEYSGRAVVSTGRWLCIVLCLAFTSCHYSYLVETPGGQFQENRGQFEKMLELAEQGNSDAMYFLGLMYAIGDGTPQDDVRAYTWFNRAASRLADGRREDAVVRREAIAKRLTVDQRAKARRFDEQWLRDTGFVEER